MNAARLLARITIVALVSSGCSSGIKGVKIDTILALDDIAQQVQRSDLSQREKRLFGEAVAREQMENGSTCYEIREGETVGDVISETQAYDAHWRAWEAEQLKAARRTGVQELSTCWDFRSLKEYQQKANRKKKAPRDARD